MFGSLSSITWKAVIEFTHMTWGAFGRFHCDFLCRLRYRDSPRISFSVRWSIFKAPLAARCRESIAHGWKLHLENTYAETHFWCSFDANLFPTNSGTIYVYFYWYILRRCKGFGEFRSAEHQGKASKSHHSRSTLGKLSSASSVDHSRSLADRLVRLLHWGRCFGGPSGLGRLAGGTKILYLRYLEHVGDTYFKRDWLGSGSFWTRIETIVGYILAYLVVLRTRWWWKNPKPGYLIPPPLTEPKTHLETLRTLSGY